MIEYFYKESQYKFPRYDVVVCSSNRARQVVMITLNSKHNSKHHKPINKLHHNNHIYPNIDLKFLSSITSTQCTEATPGGSSS
jgi:hypothetical protein